MAGADNAGDQPDQQPHHDVGHKDHEDADDDAKKVLHMIMFIFALFSKPF